MASVYYEKGQLPIAVRTYREALVLQPDFPDALNNLGNCLKERAQPHDDT